MMIPGSIGASGAASGDPPPPAPAAASGVPPPVPAGAPSPPAPATPEPPMLPAVPILPPPPGVDLPAPDEQPAPASTPNPSAAHTIAFIPGRRVGRGGRDGSAGPVFRGRGLVLLESLDHLRHEVLADLDERRMLRLGRDGQMFAVRPLDVAQQLVVLEVDTLDRRVRCDVLSRLL